MWVAVAGASCEQPSSQPLRVVCTTDILAELVADIAGDAAQVTVLIPPGSNIHRFGKDLSEDVAASADVVFHHGLGVEEGLSHVLAFSESRSDLVSVTEFVAESYPPDSHIWLDPELWKEAAGPVIAALSEHRPSKFGEFKLNGERFRARLDTLHVWMKSQISRIPQRDRIGISTHDAFGVLRPGYGVDVRGPMDGSVDSLAGWADEREVEVLFPTSHEETANVTSLLRTLQARGVTLRRGPLLYTDGLLTGQREGSHYVATMMVNVRGIVSAFGASASSSVAN